MGSEITLLEQLKSETLSVHKRLEEKLDIFNKMKSKDDYLRLLTHLYRFHAPLEEKLSHQLEWETLQFDFSKRERFNFLKKDLKALGHSLDLDPASEADLPQVHSFADALGVLYVLEGSTLGGQVISRHLNKALGINSENGGSFYHGHGEKTGEMWQSFRQLVTQYDETHPQERPRVIRAAAETFEKIENWLTQA